MANRRRDEVECILVRIIHDLRRTPQIVAFRSAKVAYFRGAKGDKGRNTCCAGFHGEAAPWPFALAAKFAAMVSRNREIPKKHSDASDFAQIVLRNHAKVNFDRLRQLGDAVYPGRGNELVRFVEDVKAGRMLRL